MHNPLKPPGQRPRPNWPLWTFIVGTARLLLEVWQQLLK